MGWVPRWLDWGHCFGGQEYYTLAETTECYDVAHKRGLKQQNSLPALTEASVAGFKIQ